MSFSVVRQGGGMAGIERDGVASHLVENDSQAWAENASFSIGVSDLKALYQEYRDIPARGGPLETKFWGRREFHMIVRCLPAVLPAGRRLTDAHCPESRSRQAIVTALLYLFSKPVERSLSLLAATAEEEMGSRRLRGCRGWEATAAELSRLPLRSEQG